MQGLSCLEEGLEKCRRQLVKCPDSGTSSKKGGGSQARCVENHYRAQAPVAEMGILGMSQVETRPSLCTVEAFSDTATSKEIQHDAEKPG